MRLITFMGLLASALAAAPPYFVLSGDSTTAKDGGWGDGFLAFVKDPADGQNIAKGGATTVSFRNGGYWATVIGLVKAHARDFEPIVTIQFGHNDQKETAGISLKQFQQNMVNFAKEVKAAGGTPIILSSLTRRKFSGGAVIENLAEHSAAALAAARSVGIQSLELNRASTDYVNAIGDDKGHYYDYAKGDSTHLNPAGTTVFGRMVADLLLEKRPDLAQYISSNEALSDKIWSGEFATGDE